MKSAIGALVDKLRKPRPIVWTESDDSLRARLLEHLRSLAVVRPERVAVTMSIKDPFAWPMSEPTVDTCNEPPETLCRKLDEDASNTLAGLVHDLLGMPARPPDDPPIAEVEVELWSTEPSAVDGVRWTIERLPGGSTLVGRDGRFYLSGGDLKFVAWACEKQGYVKRIVGKVPNR